MAPIPRAPHSHRDHQLGPDACPADLNIGRLRWLDH